MREENQVLPRREKGTRGVKVPPQTEDKTSQQKDPVAKKPSSNIIKAQEKASTSRGRKLNLANKKS